MPKNLVILGAGGVGREIAAVLEKYPLDNYDLIGFIDDGRIPGEIVNGLKVLGGIQWVIDNANGLGIILALGNPQVRKKVVEKLLGATLDYPTLIHPDARIHDKKRVLIGKGCYIADACVLTTDITIADFCFLNTACTLQHDTKIGAYSVFMPGARITGGATIGSGVYISANCAVATNGLIEDDSVVSVSVLV